MHITDSGARYLATNRIKSLDVIQGRFQTGMHYLEESRKMTVVELVVGYKKFSEQKRINEKFEVSAGVFARDYLKYTDQMQRMFRLLDKEPLKMIPRLFELVFILKATRNKPLMKRNHVWDTTSIFGILHNEFIDCADFVESSQDTPSPSRKFNDTILLLNK